MNARILAVAALSLAACTPLRRPIAPILENGATVEPVRPTLQEMRDAHEQEFLRILARRDSVVAEALRTCAGSICSATARGELALRMNAAQVMAVTGTTPDGWTIRESGPLGIMVPRGDERLPRDATGDVDLVQLHGGFVVGYNYREAQGTRVVASPEDTTTRSRATWLADQLIREGDDLVATGHFAAALDRYDRADILRPARPPLLDYKIARILDQQLLRPFEARMRYTRFLHQLELETIAARGDAAARVAAAAAQARERLIVIERERR
jgi:hypothetical protein